ncbi:Magnesium chelatase, subunit ChlI C-terminal [Clostridium cavendishii DSM 21758]|uniref:Magnesium chelatase, subunit ChlI C-terminal n=1 Tax=Clostridium cavendishii DSM 21758 TaxID=1121302 RepID=A0A1M6RJX6_9CLOT|nr:Magnesium chelatase, subunit ChlI C-terminal [Clostridium cavendishii DSM 21758]
MHIFVSYVPYENLKENTVNIDSKMLKALVLNAREMQNKRFKNTKIGYNSRMEHNDILNFAKIKSNCDEFLNAIYKNYGLSTRALDRIIKLSRTIADIYESEYVTKPHIIEALNYRKNINGEVI